MSATQLLSELQAAGLTVRTRAGWDRNGSRWSRSLPVGVMHHHTAPPVPYPLAKLDGSSDGRIKCNINTKPDGTIWLCAYKACNYSSGMGSKVVLAETLANKAPHENANRRGLADTTNGNGYYWNFENDHAGNGSSIPQVQLNAIILATQVVVAHFKLTPSKVISHAEWTKRKIDPYWNQDRRAIVPIRSAVAGTTPIPPPPSTEEEQMLPIKYQDGWNSGPRPHKRADVAFIQASFGLEYGDQQGLYGPSTADDLAKALGRSSPVMEFGWVECQQAAQRGILIGGGTSGGLTQGQADSIYAKKNHGHVAVTSVK